MTPAPAAAPHIGIFDSGVGGLSIVRTLRRDLPGARLTYLADNRYLPYGEKAPRWLEDRAVRLTTCLLDRGAQLVLVACNTATTHTIATLRRHWPALPFVGVEPGVKPAALHSAAGRIAVMATTATLASARLRELVERHGADAFVLPLPCPGLADAIDAGDDERIDQLLDEPCRAARAAGVDTVVLGCTHYPLVADRIAARLGDTVLLVDTAGAVSRRVQSLLDRSVAAASASASGRIELLATGDNKVLTRAARRWVAPALLASHIDL